ncbi:MAG: SpoIIE family protein phosphatase [Acidobacteria bacterium Pan2503]|uniref:SpoIIE family protein phosphatase n=1 Tax=Candidatus Acidiferrum panamense TaxID=2741543 RepID=A0A7V8NS60_9BACT|nr:SpoIIE family protein phosphatase [Candidatus Acidoferrum panamensis]
MNPTEEHIVTAALSGGSEISTEVLATLAEIGEEVNASLDLDEVLARAAALIKRHIDYEIFGVLMIDGDGSYLRHRFAIGYPRELAESLRIPMGQGITGTAAATGHSVRVSDTSKDPRYINAIESVRSELAVPLIVRGKCVGVLDIQSRHLDYFTRDQQNILTLLGSRLAIAIENARLFEKVKAQADTLLLLSEVGRETSAILDLEELLRRAAEQTKRVIDYQILSIMLYDQEQKVFRHRVDVKHGQSVQGRLRATTSEGIVGAAATLKEPVLVPDVTVDPRYVMVNPETRSELAIPMMHQGKVIGVLDLESPIPNYFTEDHVQTLSILAANLAVSLENARLYEQLAKEEARLERDLQAAKRIQGALLRPVPTEDYGVDIAARYLSAREVCGDLYDFLRYGPQQLGIALGDVSGKGTAAALYGAVAIGIMRSLAPQKLQPAEMLKQMNQLVGERRIEGRFMTACFATWQKGRQKLRVANAGQSQPLLYKDHRCGKIELTGFPLGIYEDVAYDEWGVTLEGGNILIFHSDGITETANSEGQFFGTTRLRELIEKHHDLPSAELADNILSEVDWFSRSAPLSDDRTLVVMKVR